MEMPTSLSPLNLSPTGAGMNAWTPPAVSSLSQQNDEAARATAEDFEGFFIGHMLQIMWADIDTDGPLGGGQAEQTFRGLLNEEYGDAIAENGGFGIADLVYREILRLQEG